MRSYLSATFLALGHRDYRLFAFGQTISVAGTWMQKLAQAWLVLVLTDSGVMLGLTAALQQLPTIFLTTVGGSLADRFEKRKILMSTAACGSVLALSIGTLVALDLIEIWMVLLAALMQGIVDAIDKPARMTLVNDIAGPEILPNAIALNNIIQDSGKLVGPALAGILIGTAGISAAFWVNGVSYLPVLVALAMVRARPRPIRERPGTEGSGFRATLRYVARRPELCAALGLMAVAGLFAYNWSVLVPLLASHTFGGDARAVGFAFSCLGLGGVLGGLALAKFVVPSSKRQITTACIFALSMGALAIAPSYAVALVVLFVVGAASTAFRSTAASLVQLTAEPHMRGRVIALYVLAMAGTSPLGAPLQGWISESFGTRVALAVGAVSTLLGAFGAYRYLMRHRAWPARTEDRHPRIPVEVAAPGASVLREDAV